MVAAMKNEALVLHGAKDLRLVRTCKSVLTVLHSRRALA
jgi:hypothetical protein